MNLMGKYEVTLTKAVRVNGKRHEAESVVVVDERTFAELKYHQAFGNVVEVQMDPNEQVQNDPNGQGQQQTSTVVKLQTLPEYKNIKADEIKEQLTLREIPFETNDKQELYEMLKTVMENESESGE